MGSFSFLKADDLTEVINIVEGAPYKLLIPKELGGGFIKDKYEGYGDMIALEENNPFDHKYDIFELFAFFNKDVVINGVRIGDRLQYDDAKIPILKEQDRYTDKNRSVGINLFYSNVKPKYPLKLVSASFKGTYEDVHNQSLSDPKQGWTKFYRKDFERKGEYEELRNKRPIIEE